MSFLFVLFDEKSKQNYGLDFWFSIAVYKMQQIKLKKVIPNANSNTPAAKSAMP